MTTKRQQAQTLWKKLHSHFVNAENVIREIIDTRAWEPLGYKTFAEAWKATMSDLTLAVEIRPHVVYQMLGEGWSSDEIAEAIRGIGPDGVEQLDRQRQNNVPADYAVVNRHYRRKPSPADTLHINVGHTMLEEYRRIAATHDTTVEDIAKDAVAERFKQLVKKPGRKVS